MATEPRRGDRAGRVFRHAALLMTICLLAVGAPAAAAAEGPGGYRIVSVTPDGEQGDSYSHGASVSADGRWVAFQSNAANLVPGDTNEDEDIFLKDMSTGAVERISVGPDGSQTDRISADAQISADGRYVSYTSWASNLVEGDTNDTFDIFVYDRIERITERVSVSSDGQQSNATSSGSAISADGRFVAFTSAASNLVPGDTNGSSDVFVRDRELGTTERVSVTSDGEQVGSTSTTPSISADGRFVTFRSAAAEYAEDDVNLTWDILVHDREAKTTRVVSAAADGTVGNDQSSCARVSGDGRHVVFTSAASNLIPADGNRNYDVFVKDLETQAVDRIMLTQAGEEVAGDFRWYSCTPDISFDGRFVFFHTLSQDVTPHADTQQVNLFAHDRLSGRTERIAVAADGGPLDGAANQPSTSPDGRYVTFYGGASNIVPGDANGEGDVFLLDRGPQIGPRWLSMDPQGDELRVSSELSFGDSVAAVAQDEAGDGILGLDLTEARVVYRPRRADLSVIWEVRELPALRGTNVPGPMPVPASPGISAPPGLVFEAGFDHAEQRYRVVGHRSAADPPGPSFELQRCAPLCEKIADLRGGYGTGGERVMSVIPLEALGASEGDRLSSLEASVTAGGAETIDAVALPDALLPQRGATLTLEVAGQSLSTEMEIQGTRIDEVVDWSGLPSGRVTATLETCLGGMCAATTLELEK